MDDLQHRLLVSQWIAEEFAGIIDEDRRAKLEAWRKELLKSSKPAMNRNIRSFCKNSAQAIFWSLIRKKKSVGNGKNSVNETGLFILFLDTGIVMWL